jgi:hypothetical protein
MHRCSSVQRWRIGGVEGLSRGAHRGGAISGESRLHGGWKGTLFNTFFVGTFNALPRSLVRRFGWHLLAFCRK